MNLQDKISKTKSILEQALCHADHRHTFVAWTGGKDSTVALSLWISYLEEKGLIGKPGAINLDTGLKFPEIVRFRDEMAEKWRVRLHVVRPDIDLAGYPVAADKVTCCRDLKIKPLKQSLVRLGARVLITGIRGDEHPLRGGSEPVEKKTDPDHVQLNPILHWTEMDIWSFIIQNSLPYCPLYDQGYTSLGCMPCTVRPRGGGERSGRDGEKEQSMGRLRSLGYF